MNHTVDGSGTQQVSHYEPETLFDIEAQPRIDDRGNRSCGCMPFGLMKIWVCQYHMGMNVGVQMGKAAKT
jgi:hypothetical protein